MDAAHPIWRTPAVRQAVEEGQFGALIRMTRTARRLTLVQVGKLVGYSASTVSRIETGRRKLTDVTLLRRFSDALGELAVTLPDVIVTAQTSLHETTGQQHDHIAALLADAYSLASDLCTRLHDDALAWVTAERARSAAQASGDVASIAEAARMTSIAMRRHGHHDTATTLLITTALDLGADSGDQAPELLATYGSLLCTASYTAALHGNRSGALELISEAETAATRLGDARVPHNPFSPTNVEIRRSSVRSLVVSLVEASGPTPPGLREFAVRCGAVA